MATKECTGCSVTSDEVSGWAECPDCGRAYCPTCVDRMGMQEEEEKIKKLRGGDPYTRMKLLCPSCESEMSML